MNTRVGALASIRSNANSFADRSSRRPRTDAARPAGSSSSDPTRIVLQLHPRAGPPQHGRDPQAQLGVGERLDHVVVGTAFQSAQAVQLLRRTRQDQHRQGRVQAGGDAVRAAHPSQQVQPRAVGELHVEDGEIRALAFERLEGVLERLGDDQVVAVGDEVVGQKDPDDRVVLDQQQRGGVFVMTAIGPARQISPPVDGPVCGYPRKVQQTEARTGDEGARLGALRDVGLLDAEPDPALERLTRLAGELLGVPISLVSLVDTGRQYFAGATGLSAPVQRETPLSHSCCRHVVERRAPLVVDDCRESAPLSDNLGVRDFGVMAYAGMPLTLSGGETLGAFCAIDRVPHQWTEREVHLLEELAALAVDVLEARRAAGRTCATG